MIARLRAFVERLRRVAEPLTRTRVGRAWRRYSDLRGNRLAGTVSFYGFVSLFPLLVLAAAIATSVAGADGVETVQDIVDENVPGVGIQIADFYRNAGAIGLIGAVLLLVSGLGWVDSLRAAVRSMWGLDDEPGNAVVRKLLDVAALAGLGLLLALSWMVSLVAGRLAEDVLDAIGVSGSLGRALLWIVGTGVSVAVSAAMFGYLLSGLPRVRVAPGGLVVAAVTGAVVFEVLKQFLVGFVVGTASQNAYAAFATPLALLAWIYLVTRLLMLMAALTAEWAPAAEEAEPAEPTPRPAADPVAALSPSARQARAVGIAAGSVIGGASTALAVLIWRAVRAFGDKRRRED